MTADRNLVRFWIELDEGDQVLLRPFGVTAIDLDDVLRLIEARIGHAPGPIRSAIEGIDISTLDDHVRPNMTPPNWRGVWFPASPEPFGGAEGTAGRDLCPECGRPFQLTAHLNRGQKHPDLLLSMCIERHGPFRRRSDRPDDPWVADPDGAVMFRGMGGHGGSN
jgi:hypothetical protein